MPKINDATPTIQKKLKLIEERSVRFGDKRYFSPITLASSYNSNDWVKGAAMYSNDPYAIFLIEQGIIERIDNPDGALIELLG